MKTEEKIKRLESELEMLRFAKAGEDLRDALIEGNGIFGIDFGKKESVSVAVEFDGKNWTQKDDITTVVHCGENRIKFYVNGGFVCECEDNINFSNPDLTYKEITEKIKEQQRINEELKSERLNEKEFISKIQSLIKDFEGQKWTIEATDKISMSFSNQKEYTIKFIKYVD